MSPRKTRSAPPPPAADGYTPWVTLPSNGCYHGNQEQHTTMNTVRNKDAQVRTEKLKTDANKVKKEINVQNVYKYINVEIII